MAASDDMRDQIQGLTEKFDGLERKFDGLEKRFDGLETRFDGLERKVDGLPTKDDLSGFKDEIINNFRVLAEEAKESSRKAAEGYGATLERIETELGELNRKVDVKFSDHDKALANHNQRLVTLERRRRRSPRG